MSFFLIVPILFLANLNHTDEIVNISAPHIYLGELLEIASQQTGVLIEASDKDGAASEELVAFIKGKKIDKLMKDIESLLSLPDAQWHWVKITRNGKEIFQIQRSVRAKNFGKFLQDKEDEEFLNSLDTICKELPSKAPHSLQSDGTDGISFNYIGLKLLQQIPRSEWKTCVAENKKIKISSGYISNKLNENLKVATKKISQMSYYIDTVQNKRILLFECTSESGEKLTYTLFEYVKKESDHFEKLKSDWLKDSGKTNTEKDYPISMAKPEYLASEIPRSLDRYISNSVKLAPFSMIGRFKITRYSSVLSEKPKSVNQLTQYLDEKSEVWHKWNDDTLLLCDYSRFLDNDSNRPAWTTVKSLRAIIKKSPDNLLSIDSLFDLSVKLTSGQLDRLGDDFKGLSWVARLQPFFQFAQSHYNNILSERGLVVDLSNPVFECVKSELPKKQDITATKSVRIRVSDSRPQVTDSTGNPVGKPEKKRTIGILFYPEVGSVFAGTGFFYNSSLRAITSPYCASPP